MSTVIDVHTHMLDNKWVMIGAVDGLGDKVVLRTAPAPYGPWSGGFTFQLPDCTLEAVAGCYRPTLHPELDVPGADAGLGLTWVQLHGQSVYRVIDPVTQETQELKVQAMRVGYLPTSAVPASLLSAKRTSADLSASRPVSATPDP